MHDKRSRENYRKCSDDMCDFEEVMGRKWKPFLVYGLIGVTATISASVVTPKPPCTMPDGRLPSNHWWS